MRESYRPIGPERIREVQAQMDEPQFKPNVPERMWKMEGLFAEAKQNHCLARAKYRGRTKVQIQAYLIAIVQNLKRLLFPLDCWMVAYLRGSTAQTRPASPAEPIRHANRLPNEKLVRTFSAGPVHFRHISPSHEFTTG
jgi:hypothetical protein